MLKKEIEYVGSEIMLATKEGSPYQGQQYYVHNFLLGSSTFSVLDYKNEYGIYPIKSSLDTISAERLKPVLAEFELYINVNGYLSVKLKNVERIIE